MEQNVQKQEPWQEEGYTKSDRPRVRWIIILGLLSAGLTVIAGINNIDLIQANPERYKDFALPLTYLGLVMGIVGILAVLLIWRYKRLGLYLGVAVWGLDLAMRAFFFVAGELKPGLPYLIATLLIVLLFYYILKYLLSYPEKLFFT
jgi:hypothetical protein